MNKYWYDLYPNLYEIRLAYLHKFFPQIEAKIQNGTLTGLACGNVITLSGELSLSAKNNLGELISYSLRITICDYDIRTDISISKENLSYISSNIGYTPTPFEQCIFKKLESSISTLYDAVISIYEWISMLDCVLNGTLHECIFNSKRLNIPKYTSASPDIDNKPNCIHSTVLDETQYIYQLPVERIKRKKRNEMRMHIDPVRPVKLNKKINFRK